MFASSQELEKEFVQFGIQFIIRSVVLPVAPLEALAPRIVEELEAAQAAAVVVAAARQHAAAAAACQLAAAAAVHRLAAAAAAAPVAAPKRTLFSYKK